MHRQNLHNLQNMIELAVDLDAERLEVAQVQYYGWALKNQTAFLPTREQLDKALADIEELKDKARETGEKLPNIKKTKLFNVTW